MTRPLIPGFIPVLMVIVLKKSERIKFSPESGVENI